jgi:streptogramin lyase
VAVSEHRVEERRKIRTVTNTGERFGLWRHKRKLWSPFPRRLTVLTRPSRVAFGLLTLHLTSIALLAHSARADFLTASPLPFSVLNRQPTGIAVGADGATWFTLYASGQIGRYSGGSFSFWDLPVATSQPLAITAGPDSRFWFTEYGSGKIGRIAANGTIDEFPLSSGAHPYFITAGPDGNLWFTDFGRKSICRTTTSGSVSEFPVGGSPAGIAVGPDGNLWYTLFDTGAVGSMTTSGSKTEYTLPSAASGPHGITPGPDGNVWFTELTGNRIGRITLTGALTEFDVPRASAQPWAIAAASDGLLYFSEYAGHAIGRMKTDGTMSELLIRSSYAGPSTPAGIALRPDGELEIAVSNPELLVETNQASVAIEIALPVETGLPGRIVQGPDGNGWFTMSNPTAVGRITPFGTVTILPVTGSSGDLPDICIGPDGNLWFTDLSSDRLGRVTPAGVMAYFPVPAGTGPNRICAGPDGNLWLTEATAPRIGRMTPAGAFSEFPYSQLAPAASSITAGADGNLWFAYSSVVVRMSPTGTFVEFQEPAGLWPKDLVAGPDGNIWYQEVGVGSVSPGGVFTKLGSYAVRGCYATGLASGVSGELWIGCLDGSAVRFLPATGEAGLSGLDPPQGGQTVPLVSLGPLGPLTSWAVSQAGYSKGVLQIRVPVRGFYTLPPCRLLDTRKLSSPMGGQPLPPGFTLGFVPTGSCRLPTGARAVSLNVTVTETGGNGYLSCYPGSSPPPGPTSILNYSASQTRANNTIISLPSESPPGISFFNGSGGTIHLVVDVNGFFY